MMDVSVAVTVMHDEQGWHYAVRATEVGVLLARIEGDFNPHATLDQVEAFAAWVVRVVCKPRLGDDLYCPPEGLAAAAPVG
jgi:hypothetical protein